MKICVVGIGYMGLPTALILASKNYDVLGYDIDKQKVQKLQEGKLPFEEKGLQELYNLTKDRFRAISQLEQAEAYIITVPTPLTIDKKCDLNYVKSASESLIPFIKKNVLVILESTVKPGTTENVVRPILEKSGLKAEKDFHLGYVSEKAIPGNTINEMIHNDRIIGGIDDNSQKLIKSIYQSFVKGTIHVTDCTTSETVKLLENIYRDTNIALANELVRLTSDLKINLWEAISLANNHPRVNIHYPGPGVGGHCIAIDPWFLVEDYNDTLIHHTRSINDNMPGFVVSYMETILKNVEKPNIAILGATYKKNVDDPREAPSKIIKELCEKNGWEVKITDPFVQSEEIVDFETAIQNVDFILIAVDHDTYIKKESLLKEKEKLGIKIFDARNLFKGKFPTIGNNK